MPTLPDPARRFFRRYDRSHANNWAVIIAWNALVAFVPILVALVAVFSLLLSRRGFATFVETHIAALVHSPAERAATLRTLSQFKDRAGELLGGVVLAMLWSGSALFASFDNGLSAIFGAPSRPFIRKRLRGMLLIFLFAALLIPLLGSSALLSLARRYALLPPMPGAALIISQFLVGLISATLMFLLIYRTGPNRALSTRRLFPGALAAGCLLELLSFAFPVYIHNSDDLANYGVVLGLIVLVVTFFYLLGQITIVGAVLNVEMDREWRQLIPESGWSPTVR